tara:strand:- start:83 stop:874 length:792 start_codon:yes stop_codon:yes gene_type:complete
MAFKMNGWGGWQNQPPQGAQGATGPLNKNQSERAVERLTKKQQRLEEKLNKEGISEGKKGRLENRISNVKNKLSRKKQMVKNIKEGKPKRANLNKDVNRDLGVATLETQKTTNEQGRKDAVTRTLKNNKGEVIRGTEKKKSGEGLNVTTDKTIVKKGGEKVVKKVDGEKVKKNNQTPTQTFKEAFAAARKAGKENFMWDGRKYHTETREEQQGVEPGGATDADTHGTGDREGYIWKQTGGFGEKEESGKQVWEWVKKPKGYYK